MMPIRTDRQETHSRRHFLSNQHKSLWLTARKVATSKLRLAAPS